MKNILRFGLVLVIGLALGLLPVAAEGGITDRLYLDIGAAMPFSYSSNTLGFGMAISADVGMIFLGNPEATEGLFVGASAHSSAGFLTLFGEEQLNIASPYLQGAGALNIYMKISSSEYLMVNTMVGVTRGFSNYDWDNNGEAINYPDELMLTISPQVGIGTQNEYGVTNEYFLGVNIMPDVTWNIVAGARIRLGGKVLHK